MRKLFGFLAAGALLLAAGGASAAPVNRTATLNFNILIQGLSGIPITAPGATVVVDETAGTIALGAAAFTLATPVNIPVTGATAINSLTATAISNQSGTFSIGGAANAEPFCGPTPIGSGVGCAVGANLGGKMGLAGAIKVHVIPNIVVIPVNLNGALIGQGGFTNVPFTFDAAGWTTGTGLVGTANGTAVTVGTLSAAGSQLTLVTPTFVSALGNLLPIFSSLQIAFTDGGGLPRFLLPEPGTLLLLGTGFAGLMLLGRRRK